MACPYCEGLARYTTLLSGNTIGAHISTDGKRVLPMFWTPPAVVKCRHCAACYWLADAREVGTIDVWGKKPEELDLALAATQEVEEPTEEGYYWPSRRTSPRTVRRRRPCESLAWWRSNDAFRDVPQEHQVGIAVPSGSRQKNLEAIASLLDDADEGDRIMKAEVCRELGEFESAVEVLSALTSDEYAVAVRQLRLLFESKDARVKELRFEG